MVENLKLLYKPHRRRYNLQEYRTTAALSFIYQKTENFVMQ